jgi:hypothetical protein
MTFPGTAPARRVHVPSVPSGTLPDPGGRDSVERAHRLQRQTADLYTRWRASFPHGIDPDELKDTSGQFAYSDAALALPDALDAVKVDADSAAKQVNDLIKGMRVDGDVASQLGAQRYWSRAQRTLDAAKDPAKVVAAAQGLINNADDSQAPVLAEELSSYLASRNVPTDWLTDALASKIPGLSDASAEAIRKSRQYAVLLQNHQRLYHAMEKDVAAPQLLDPAQFTAEPYTGG